MERAEFTFQIYFDTFDLKQRLNDSFSLNIRLFDLPSIKIEKMAGLPGNFDIKVGKSLILKMPYVEILDECPLSLIIKASKPEKTSLRKMVHKIQLQNIFSLAIQNPNRPVDQKFIEVLKMRSNQEFGTLNFKIRVTYTSSTQESLVNLPPIVVQNQLSMESEMSAKKTTIKKKEVGTDAKYYVPDSRTRSIFFFDKNELLEENRQLTQEIESLKELVDGLKCVLNSYDGGDNSNQAGSARERGRKASTQKAQSGYVPKPMRTDFIYQPPGLQTGKPRNRPFRK